MNADLRCSHVAALLPAHADGELDAADRHAVDIHLAACVDCRALRAHEIEFTALLRQRLQTRETAPASLRAAVRGALGAQAASPWWARALSSPWAPRWAAAVVLAVLVAIPLAWLPHRGAAQAQVAADQHRSHAFVPGEPLPPCCTAVAAGVGTELGPPSPGARVPDLAPADLHLAIVVVCTFTGHPVHLASYTGGDGGNCTLTVTDRTRRQFKLARAQRRDGVLQTEARIEGVHGAFDVTRWMDDGLVYTWVRPADDARGRAALALLLNAAR
jgi:anti-sigma factor RsiW